MMMIEQTVAVPENRHVNFDVILPDTLPHGQVQVVVSFIPTGKESKTDPVLEKALEDAEKKWAYNHAHPEELTATLDKLRVSGPLFGGADGVTYQRNIRDEWEDRLVKMGLSSNVDCMRRVHTPPLWGDIKGMDPETNTLLKQPYPGRSALNLTHNFR
ncbi:hypothetical protein AGMMS49991_03470 [Spirochaetia bacterium]|nr:hypothetical protein AGMMS49991_03470 [Spirochaetia bacterium]